MIAEAGCAARGRLVVDQAFDQPAAASTVDRLGDRHHLTDLVEDEEDGDAAGLHHLEPLEQLVDADGDSTAVGSSRISTFASVTERPGDLDRLLGLDRQVADAARVA